MKSIIFISALHQGLACEKYALCILCQCNINAHCAVLSVICLYLYFRMLLVCLRMCSIFVFVRALPTLYCALDFARGKKGVHSYGNFSLKRVYTCAHCASLPLLVKCVSGGGQTHHHQLIIIKRLNGYHSQ